MSLIAVGSVLTVVVSPITFAETEFDFLPDDLKLLEEEIGDIENSESNLDEDLEYEQDLEIFPGREEDDTGLTVPDLKEGTHVTVKVGNWDVALTDVPVDQWFAPYVQDMAEKGVISGYKDAVGVMLGLYGPADSVTIEQIAKIAVEASGVDQSKCALPTKNKSAVGTWSEVYIACAEHYGWSIYSDGSVDLYRKATRAEVVTTVLQAFGRDFEMGTGNLFEDVTSTMQVRYAIETAALDGIVGGYTDVYGEPTGFFGPYDPVNRAETAKIVSLAIQVYQ